MNEEERKMSKAANEANESNKANGTYGSNGAYGTVSQPQGKPLEPKTFLPKKGNYRGLIVYQKAECIYDITFYFAHHYFVERKDRTIDQVVQAARSAKQNIAEGCAAASTSAETEIKLIGVARASMKETLEDFKDYLRTRHLEEWSLDDPRTHQTQEFCKKHNRPEDYTKDIEKRSPEALCNIAITLICQYDVMMGRLLDRLQKDFVEKGGIREQMTAARLGYRNEQKARIAELEAENAGLKARIAELERKVKELMGPMGLIGLIGPIGLMGLIRLMGLIGLMGLVSCSSSSEEAVANEPPTPVNTEVAISFSGSESQEEAVSNGENNKTNRAYGTYGANRRAAGKSLSESATSFTVWGYKNMSYTVGSYGDLQTVFPGYQVDWHDGSAVSTTSNSNGWEYVRSTPTEQTIKYWDFSAKAYRFFGVTSWSGAPPVLPAVYEAHKTYGANGVGTYEVSMLADASNATEIAATPFFSRLWFSDGSTEPSSPYYDKQFGKPVTLEFVKPLARVRFLFKYAYPREGIKLGSTKSFKPTDGTKKIARKGIVTVSYPLTGTATRESYTIVPQTGEGSGELTAFTEDCDPEDDGKVYTADAPGGWYTVLPVLTQGSFTLTATVNAVERTVVVPAEYMTWLPGYSYTYIFKITEEGGVEIGWVEYAVTPWSELEADHTVYNW